MQNDRWQAIEGLFHAARDLHGDDRTSFLDRECGEDGAMRHQVEVLLAHESNAAGFLETPALAMTAQATGSPALNAHQKLGIYTIVSRLGSGGMGEVYRARDATLGREVAIKILPTLFSNDPGRLRRLEREARLLAVLNHPNIAAIHNVGEANGSRFLVLELVEGETLAERIRHGALPVEEALRIAKDICSALEAAHEKGVIHHDLKPANVKITPEGIVKVLDFGLAKSLEAKPTNENLSPAPAIQMTATLAGMIVGTAAYMSPEQAKGLNTDQRSDIFSFGSVLYEMLTGRQAFQGDSVSDVLASILAREPDFGLMPQMDPKIHTLLRRSLEKNPKRRWHAIGDLRMELETILADPRAAVAEEQRTAAPKPLWKRAIPVFAAIVLTTAITSVSMWYFRPLPLMEVTRFSIPLTDDQQFTNAGRSLVTISADGTQVVYVADRRLYRKAMSEPKAKPITGTEIWQGAVNPAFSPDGRFLVFWSVKNEMLMKISVSGGPAVPLCRAENPFGISWGEDGIVFGQGSKGIMRVSKDGGTPEVLVGVKSGEFAGSPQVLPDGQTLLYTLAAGNTGTQWDDASVFVQSLNRSSEPKLLFQGGSDARYVSTGHIVYAVEGRLYAVPFDLRQPQRTGGKVPVVEGVLRGGLSGVAQFSLSSTGTLIYIPGPVTGAEFSLAVMSRTEPEALDLLKFPLKSYGYPRVSPEGRRVAFSTEDGNKSNVWIYDRDGTTAPRQLTSGGMNRYPIWSDDGERIMFQSDREGDLGIFWQRADGKDKAVRLTRAENGVEHIPDSWSHACECFSYTAIKGAEAEVWTYSVQDRKAKVFARKDGSFIGRSAFSPDGHWLAYQSDETSKVSQIYVQPFPNAGTQYPPLIAGGHPVWSTDQTRPEIFYNAGAGRISVVSIKTQPIAHGVPTSLPDGLQNRKPDSYPRFWDVLDGNHLLGVHLANQASSETAPLQIQVVLNWFEDLRRLSPH